MLYSDLECDYLNAQECCGRLNFWNIPKLWLQLVILAVLLVSGHWSLVLLNIPVCAWLVRKFHWVPRGNIGKVSVQYPRILSNSQSIFMHFIEKQARRVHVVIHDEIKLLKLHSTYLEPCLTLDTLCLNVFSTLSCKLQNCNQTEGSHYKIC